MAGRGEYPRKHEWQPAAALPRKACCPGGAFFCLRMGEQGGSDGPEVYLTQ